MEPKGLISQRFLTDAQEVGAALLYLSYDAQKLCMGSYVLWPMSNQDRAQLHS